MNIIIDALPDTVNLGGVSVPIRTDFRIGMLFETMIESREMTAREMAAQAFLLYFDEDALAAIAAGDLAEAAMDAILWFYTGGKDADARQRMQDKKQGGFARRIYDFEIDAPKIYAAFYAQYGIDLQDAQLHWWKFIALFSGLHEDEEIMKIMSYRAVNLAEIKNKQERQRLAKLQAMYALPDGRTAEEKALAAGAIFGGMG